jgi:DNA-binding transcriptional LysR family regulator
MELRDLRALVAVARSGSFTAAAAELGYTQSAVSQQIAALEQAVGQQLLERRPVRPTPAGRRLVEHASRILLRVDVARSELARAGGVEGVLRVDACPLAVPAALAGSLRQLRQAQPALRVVVHTTDAATALAELAAGTVDVALVDGIGAPGNPLAMAEAGLFSSTALAEERLVLVLPADHPLAGRKGLDLSALVDAPWVVAPRLAGGPALPTPHGAVTYEGTDVVTLLNLVASGHGTALLPESVPVTAAGVATVPLRHPDLVHRTEVLVLREPGVAAQALVDALRERARLG